MFDIRKSEGDTSWFVKDRFGMFIHWGLYALPARHEWVKHLEQISDEDYKKYFDHFDPDLYDPELWASLAEEAGMKYFVITTKHHEGFCLWDSQLTDYKCTNTPYKKEILRPMVDAFRHHGLKTGFYHSLIDWNHPNFVIDDMHSARNCPNREELNKTREQKKYAQYLTGQIEELLTNYGKIDILWCDFSYPSKEGFVGKGKNDWESENLYKIIRKLQPHVILNDRLDVENIWDIKTPEQFQPSSWVEINGQKVVWEACQTFSGSWGYHRDETSWKSSTQLLTMLIDTVSKGGNLLLNVGPTGRGEFDYRAVERLKGMGKWMRRNSRSIYNCTQVPFDVKVSDGALITYNPDNNKLYIHLINYPVLGYFSIKGISDRIEYAQFLHDASEIRRGGLPGGMSGELVSGTETVFHIPILKPNEEIPVVEIFLK